MKNENDKESKPAFWSTLPGILTALGGTIGAVAALITALYTAGFISSSQPSESKSSALYNQPAASSPTIEPQPSNTKTAESTKIDRTDARSTAGAILRAYKSRDIIALAGLNSPENRQIFLELAEQGESHPRYKSIFSGWRWQAVQAWDGQVGEVRYTDSQAKVKFGELGPDEILVVTLNWINDRWFWEDVHSPSPEQFESGSRTR